MKFTWHKTKCTTCSTVRRYRGKPDVRTRRCDTGWCVGVMYVTAIHWGAEKYAGTRAGTVEKCDITPIKEGN